MKQIAFGIIALLLLNSCLNKNTTLEKEPHQDERVQAIDFQLKNQCPPKDKPNEYLDYKSITNEISLNGS